MKFRSFQLIILLVFISGCTLPVALNPSSGSVGSPTPSPFHTLTPTPTPTPIPLPSDHIRNGDAAWFNGDYDKALEEFQFALNQSQDPASIPAALFGIGQVYIAKNDCATAMDAFNQLISQYPETPQVVPTYFQAGKCYDATQNYAQAAIAYDVLLKLKPGILDEFFQTLKGDALVNAKDFSGAISAYQSALGSNPPADWDTMQEKIGDAYASSGDTATAQQVFVDLYDRTLSDYTKARADFRLGQLHLILGETDQANNRFMDSVTNFPKSIDSYYSLVQLVDTNVTVNDFDRGLVDYFAGQYFPAIDALTRYINGNTQHPGSVHYYLGLSYQFTDQPDAAIQQFDSLIADHPDDKFWPNAWDEKAYTQWVYLSQFEKAAKTLLDFVAQSPGSEDAPGYLFDAARIYERGNLLPDAAANWERLINEYPASTVSMRGLFLAGITQYRLGLFDKALVIFQRYLVLSADPEERSAGIFWIAKTKLASGDAGGANADWLTASQTDPGGYYSIRANEILQNEAPLQAPASFDLAYDLDYERSEAEAWMRSKFNLPASTDLVSLGELSSNIHILRGDLFWQLGLKDEASSEFETLRNDLSNDAVNSFRLLEHLVQIQLYRTAILTSRQVLDLANLDDATSLEAPIYFNHIRFGAYYRDLVVADGLTYGINPLVLFSLIRQESLFESFIQSSAGAVGLMQMMPGTGQDVASKLRYPLNFSQADLPRPVVNILYGTEYLFQQKEYLSGDIFAAIAAYNAGPGNASKWMQLANNDPDLFMEIVRFDETRTYLQQIVEFLHIYRTIYER